MALVLRFFDYVAKKYDFDAWEQRRLGMIADVIDGDRGKNYPSKSDFTKNGHTVFLNAINVTKQGFSINERQYISKEKSESMGNGKLRENDVVLTSRGSLGHIAYYNSELKRIIPFARINSGMLILRSQQNTNALFIIQFLKSPIGKKQIKLISFGSAQPQLTKKDIKNYKIILPIFKEQEKIGSILNKLDNTIALHQKKLLTLKKVKTGLLQTMFQKNYKSIPILRFTTFNEYLEQRKFKDILKSHPFKQYLSEPMEKGSYEIIQQGNNPIAGYANGIPFKNFEEITLFGDHTVSLYKLTNLFFIATDGVKILSSNNIDGNYLFTLLERYKPKSQGYKRHFTILKNENVWFTKTSEEQKKIGLFFKQLDNLIVLYQIQLDKLQKIKKAYLQKMFI